MNAIKQFKNGLDVGLFSFGILWKHKKLILYLSVPKIVGMLFELTKHNLFFVSPIRTTLFLRSMMSRFFYTFDGMQDVVILLLEMTTILITIFATVALTIHTFALLKKRKTGIKKSLKEAGKKIKPILLWTLISTAVYFLIDKLDILAYPYAGASCRHNLFFASTGILARLAWAIAFLFVITLIAVEDKPLAKLVQKSFSLLRKLVWNYLGAMTWVVLIAALGIGPLWFFSKQLAGYGIIYITMAIIMFITATVPVIAKTVLYERHASK